MNFKYFENVGALHKICRFLGQNLGYKLSYVHGFDIICLKWDAFAPLTLHLYRLI